MAIALYVVLVKEGRTWGAWGYHMTRETAEQDARQIRRDTNLPVRVRRTNMSDREARAVLS